jgi:tRNA 5-methylaminomethyl-2-thiouridine biosynthesis bifunctional protein
MMTRAVRPAAARALLAAAALPERWAGAGAFTVLDLDLADGGVLVDAVLAWHADPRRCASLRWAALARHAPSREALGAALDARDVPAAIADPLRARWPPPTPGVHRIELDGGRIRISIAVGAAQRMLPGWLPHADALLVPVRAGAPLEAPALRAAGAMLVAGGVAALVADADAPPADVADALAALSAAGLQGTALARPHGGGAAWRATRVRGRAPTADGPAAREALVVGAGLAGGSIGAALARRGWAVARLDAGDGPSTGSLQPVLAQHPSVSPDDAPLSRLTRAATLLAQRVAGAEALRPLGRLQCVDEAFAARAARGLPPQWVRAVDAAEASALAGVRLRTGGLWLPQACSADPRSLRDAWTPGGLHVIAGRRVERLERTPAGWRALDAHGTVIAEAPVAVLACGGGEVAVACAPGGVARPLAALLGPAGLRTRAGATTVARAARGQRPSCIVGGDGHAVPIDGDALLLGPAPASQASGADADEPSRAWRRWAAQLADPGPTPRLRAGPSGTRLSARDHLPIAGPVPDPDRAGAARTGRDDAPGALAGLWVATALGGRGLLWSVLCAELIAASLEREPAPLERALARHLAPERFLVRALRQPDTAG